MPGLHTIKVPYVYVWGMSKGVCGEGCGGMFGGGAQIK